jgi:hypothetical protein
MAYRTKQFNILFNEFLKPVMDFVGITISDDPGCGLIKYVGCDRRDEKGKVVPTYFVNQYNKDKIYTIVSSQDEFINYRSRKDDLDYFNPFVKYKNALLLLLMMTPVVYEKILDENTDYDIADLIVDDELNVTQEEILKHVRILQYPLEKDNFGDSYYSYGIEFSSDDMSSCEPELIESLRSTDNDKIVAIWTLIFSIMNRFEEPLPMLVSACGGSTTQLRDMFVEILKKYDKERELNRKDIKKIKIETNVEVYNSDELEALDVENYESVADAFDSSETDEEITTSIDITNKYKDAIPIIDKDDDDDMLDLDLF